MLVVFVMFKYIESKFMYYLLFSYIHIHTYIHTTYISMEDTGFYIKVLSFLKTHIPWRVEHFRLRVSITIEVTDTNEIILRWLHNVFTHNNGILTRGTKIK